MGNANGRRYLVDVLPAVTAGAERIYLEVVLVYLKRYFLDLGVNEYRRERSMPS